MNQEKSFRVAGSSEDMETFSCEVAIVGAGLAGGTLALRLARRGIHVILLEAQAFPREKLCGEYLSPEGVEVLDNLGIGPDSGCLTGHPIRLLRLTTPRGSLLESTVVASSGRPALGIRRSLLDSMIANTAGEFGAQLLSPARALGPWLEGQRVVGVLARVGKRPVRIRARVVVAADGRQSALLRSTGQVRVRTSLRPRHFGLKCHLPLDAATGEPAETVGLHLVPGGYVGTCLVEGGMNNLCGLLKETELQHDRGNLENLVNRVFTSNKTLERIWNSRPPASVAWKTVSAVRVQYSRSMLPGIFYAGDCQGTVDPLGGQGMTMALLGAEMLEPYILDFLRSDTSDISQQRLYERAWHQRFDRRIHLCRALHQALVHPRLLDAVAPFRRSTSKLMAGLYQMTRDPKLSNRHGNSLTR